MFITNGGLADIFLVFANTRKSGGIRGLTAFIVPKDTPGFSIGKKKTKWASVLPIPANLSCKTL